MPGFELNERVMGRAPDINGELGIVRHIVGAGRTQKFSVAFDNGHVRDCIASHLWHSDAPLDGENVPPMATEPGARAEGLTIDNIIIENVEDDSDDSEDSTREIFDQEQEMRCEMLEIIQIAILFISNTFLCLYHHHAQKYRRK